MQYIPPSTYGWLTTTIRRLYQELHEAGYDHTYLIDLSLRKALLLRYLSPAAIDATFGVGVYQGIKSSHGPYSQWRKIWSRVIEEQEAQQPARFAALSAHIGTHNTCLALGLSEREISKALQMNRHSARFRLAS